MAINMRDWPQPFWAIILAAMGGVIVMAVLYSGAEKDIKIAIIGVASSLITGALGYIGGRSGAASGTTEVSTTTANPIVQVTTTQPKEG